MKGPTFTPFCMILYLAQGVLVGVKGRCGHYHAKFSTVEETTGSGFKYPDPKHPDDVGLLGNAPIPPTLFVGFTPLYFYFTNRKHSKYRPPSSINPSYNDTQKMVKGFVRDHFNKKGYPWLSSPHGQVPGPVPKAEVFPNPTQHLSPTTSRLHRLHLAYDGFNSTPGCL
ncbi:uncharacterized protein C8R40DRAFT_801074 [Lentinula edodes]|uniref:uncharacterized protein n=1 Tax=Lentinula edodes TaxID=5353 RepID=UPI001E8DC035|nr:uncharacterized protein C8R40DRAFT_801074 [Lentinula edodes]KAH7868852.1 hypothetical protein C8R40DRAFT_801074 [Lentinula edodes]